MSEKIDLVSSTGAPYQVELPPPTPGLKSCYIFAFAKSGSTLLNNMVQYYCDAKKVATFSIFEQAFGQGIPTGQIDQDALACFRDEGYVYCGFRHFPHFHLDVSGSRVVWLTRDPRDMAVSHYYSIRHSHKVPKGMTQFLQRREQASEMDVNEFVLQRSKSYSKLLARYRENLGDREVTIYRYEDVIYNKADWLTDVVDRLGIEVDRTLANRVAKRFDVVPSRERIKRHVRQVHPGNHREKLSPETIEQLNDDMHDFLDFFGYAA